MIDQLMEWDKELFLYLNSFHTPWLDPVMLLITETLVWLPLYIFLLYLVVHHHPKNWWIVLIAIAITILLADQITSTLMKPYFARLRPSRDPALEALVHIVGDYRGGKFGFASSHAANTFGLATFFFLLMGKVRHWMWVLFLWAAVITYSRIYLGVHYPGDIVIGSLIGMLAGLASFKLFEAGSTFADKRRSGVSRGT
jgi:undecaprenyl-diphosphatase